MKTRFCFH